MVLRFKAYFVNLDLVIFDNLSNSVVTFDFGLVILRWTENPSETRYKGENRHSCSLHCLNCCLKCLPTILLSKILAISRGSWIFDPV